MREPAGIRQEATWFLLLVVDDQQPQRQIPIDRHPFRIGRRPNLPLSLPSSRVSQDHAEIVEKHDGQLWLSDLRSTNGTYVNGTCISDAVALKEGDIVRFATIEFQVGHELMDEDDGPKTWWELIRYALND